MPPPWKPQNGFHRGLEISLENARFPHSHRRPSSSWDRRPNGRTGQRQHDQARSRRGGRAGTPGGKVLNIPGPFLLKTDSAAVSREPFLSPFSHSGEEGKVKSVVSLTLI